MRSWAQGAEAKDRLANMSQVWQMFNFTLGYSASTAHYITNANI